MTIRSLLGLALLWPAAAHAACPASTTVEVLEGALNEAEAAYRSVDLDGFTLAMDSAALVLPCLGETLTPKAAGHLHRMNGLSSVIRRKSEDAARSFTAAKAADPDYVWPEDLIPPGHVIRTTYDQANPAATKFDVPAPPETGALWFDGAASEKRPTSRPAVFQWVDADGTVKATALVKPSASLPSYPAKAVPKPTPAPEPVATTTPEGAGTSTSTTVDNPGGGGSLALPAAVTGGAVALGAGSAVLFFGPTKGAFNTYNDMYDAGQYAAAEEHFTSKVVPPRTASQVLAGAAVVGLGVGAFLWTQSVEVRPMPNGVFLQGRF
ncbi:MAG: hypothetical protein EP330_02475 [Deltaproteobacteria bacterium]|nr:MAG: hypothetical protein EP330_02475 [Deltaproteobacteria bacterium]